MIGLGLHISKLAFHGSGEGAPTNLYNGLNAADPTNEVNGVANTNGQGNFTVTSETTPTPQNGSYYVNFKRDLASGNATGTLLFSGLALVETSISFYYNIASGTTWQIRLISAQWGSSQTFALSGSGWIHLPITATPTNTGPTIEVRNLSGGSPGEELGIDNIVVTQ